MMQGQQEVWGACSKGLTLPKCGLAPGWVLGGNVKVLGMSCLTAVSLLTWDLGPHQVVHVNMLYMVRPWTTCSQLDPWRGWRLTKVSHGRSTPTWPTLNKNLGHQGLGEFPWLVILCARCHTPVPGE